MKNKKSSALFFQDLIQNSNSIWMGIINLTPDSFSDGGKYFLDPEKTWMRCQEMIQAGAQILDFGGVSTKPGSQIISSKEELKRILNILVYLKNKLPPHILISIDTYSPLVAEVLAQQGLIDIINDVYSGRIIEENKNTLDIAAQYDLAYIIMHMQKNPQTMQQKPFYKDCLNEIVSFLYERIQFAKKCGVCAIAVDPGIGFGKNLEHNLELISQEGINFLKKLKSPILIGLSRKSFISQIYSELKNPESRDRISKELELQCLLYGAKIIRSHVMLKELS